MKKKIIAFPLRKTVDVSVSEGVCQLIDLEFHQSSKKYQSQLRSIDALRSKMKTNVININSVVVMKKYYNYLLLLGKQFQSGLDFGWFNCFASSELVTIKSFRYERIMVLYQLAAMYTQLSFLESEYKSMGIYYQYSAGCLQVIIDDLSENGPLDNDKTDANISAIRSLYYLSLAQAQELFWLKAKQDSVRDTVLVKLSQQISTLYEKSYEFAKMSDLFKPDWYNYLQAKIYHFEAATLFRYSQYISKKELYGDEISYLKQGISILSNQPDSCMLKDVLEDSKILQSEMKKRLIVAERDNSTVHLQTVPPFDDFKAIQGAELSKPVIPKELAFEFYETMDDKDMFDSLVPIGVLDKCTEIIPRIEQYLESEIVDPLTFIKQDINSFLDESQIHGQLDSLVPQNVPESVIQFRDVIIENGFTDTIINEMNKLNGLRVKCKSCLDTILDSVDSIGDTDNADLSQLIKNFSTLNAYIIKAEEGDLTITRQIEELKPFLDLFKSIDSLNEFLPNAQIENLNPDLIQHVGKLKTLLKEFEELSKKCDNLKLSTETKLSNLENDLRNETIEEYKKGNDIKEVIDFDSCIQKFNLEIESLNEIRSIESNIKLDFNSQFQRFLSLKSNVKISPARQESLNVLNSTYNGYLEVLNNLTQGLEFYTNLQARIDRDALTLEEYLYPS